MKYKAILLDFDGTLVTKDQLGVVTDLVGKREDSLNLDRQFHLGKQKGLSGLVQRINLLKGVKLEQITKLVEKDESLVNGARELCEFCRTNSIFTVVASGNIEPILSIYQKKLGFDHIIGSPVPIIDGVLGEITAEDYPKDESGRHFKVIGIESFLKKNGIQKTECIAVGDSRGDIGMFNYVGKKRSIAINPRGNIEEYVNFVVKDLHEVINIINSSKF